MTKDLAEDQLAIQQVLLMYARGIDRFDLELVRAAFWDDAIDTHGAFTGLPDAFIEHLKKGQPKYRATTHFLAAPFFAKLTNDQATAETSFMAWHALQSPRTGGHIVTGRYLDKFKKRGGEWRIIERVAVYDWNAPLEFSAEPRPGELSGTRDSDDPSYRVMGRVDNGRRA